jgi:hypothetical protein
MAFDTTEYQAIYNAMETQAIATTETFFNNYALTGEEQATVISSVMTNLITSALRGMHTEHEIALQQEKLTLEQSLRAEKIESADLENQIKSHRLNTTMPKQDEKIDADKDFVVEQKAQLSATVGYNNKIKTLGHFTSLFGTMGAGGMIVPDEGWAFISAIGNDLTSQTLTSAGFQSGVTTI